MRYLFLSLLILVTTCLMAQRNDADYKKLEDLSGEGKYKSALEIAETIYRRAADSGDQDEMIKALGYRSAFTRELGEDGAEDTRKLLLRELAENPDRPVVTPLLHIMLGEVYHAYGQDNGYRLSQLTDVADAELTDSATLDKFTLGQLREASLRHTYRGLEQARQQGTALAEIPAIVAGNTERRNEMPTLYDLLVDRAMDILG